MSRDTDIATLENVCKVIGLLNTFIDSLATESCVTVSALKPVHHLTNDLLTEETNDNELVKHMKAAIKDDLIARYSRDIIKKLIDIACFLNPRFKDSFFKNIEDTTVNTANETVVTAATVKLPQQTVPTGTENAAEGSTCEKESLAPGGLCQLLQNSTTTQQLQMKCAEVENSNETRARSEIISEIVDPTRVFVQLYVHSALPLLVVSHELSSVLLCK
ncbi:UNVERIFIED_CONTAM: hypothetical protein FKN15_048501 [Acipenser sinensis]